MKRDRIKKLLRYAVPFIALALIYGFAVVACGGEPATEEVSKVGVEEVIEEEAEAVEEAKTKEEEEYSIEYKLAVINTGGFIEEDDETVQEFKILLDKLEKKVVNSRQDIADIAVKAQEVLKDDGYNIQLIQIMRDLNTAIPEGLEGVKLEEIAAAYMVLVEQ